MKMPSPSELTAHVVDKAKALGASVAGVAEVGPLQESPSHLIYSKIGMDLNGQWSDRQENIKTCEVVWPLDAVSAVVIGVVHSAREPELDWWDGKGTPGNRILMRINKELSAWIESTYDITTHKLPYLIEKGGIFIKDAAVMAGLGSMGRNNMVITPEYGPRIRFRVLLLDRDAEPTGPLDFSPCEDCAQPCRKACPVNAFGAPVYSARELGQSILPGIDGSYDRVTCNGKMDQDIEDALAAMQANDAEHREMKESIDAFEGEGKVPPKAGNEPSYWVKYCRTCELSCPVGKDI